MCTGGLGKGSSFESKIGRRVSQLVKCRNDGELRFARDGTINLQFQEKSRHFYEENCNALDPARFERAKSAKTICLGRRIWRQKLLGAF